ncbi:hypothetical protein MHU86_25642 [Fragilaria crotonensis]|nr:hypothetical protein MHU86_25642 [Fragilaria crotonensis]
MAVGIRVAGEEGTAGVEEAVFQATFLLRAEAEHELSEIRSEQQSHSISPQSMKRLMAGVQSEAGIVPVSSLAENDNLVRSVNEAREVGYFRSGNCCETPKHQICQLRKSRWDGSSQLILKEIQSGEARQP